MGDSIDARLAAVDQRLRDSIEGTHIEIQTRRKDDRIAFVVTGYGDNFAVLKKTYGWFTVDEAEAVVERRLVSAMAEQRAQGRRLGGPPLRWAGIGDVDLAPYMIERPVLSSIAKTRDEAEARDVLRRSVFYGVASAAPWRATYIPSTDEISLSLRRGVVRGSFRLSPTIRWSEGTVIVENSHLPDTVLSGMRGAELHRFVAHPMLPADIVILHARNERHAIRKKLTDVCMAPTRGGLVGVEEGLREIYGRMAA